MRSEPNLRAEKYRKEATRIRREAESTKNYDVRSQLIDIARKYEALAESIDHPKY